MLRTSGARVVLPRCEVRDPVGIDEKLEMVSVIADAEKMVRKCILAGHGVSGWPHAGAAGVRSVFHPTRSVAS